MFNSNKPLPSTAWSSRESSPPPPPPISKHADEEAAILPSIDGPPSPRRIRAYAEQIRTNPPFPPPSKMYSSGHAFSTPSVNSSLRSGSPSAADMPRLSRKSSSSSTSKKSQKDRPESVINFGKTLFSRSKKAKRDTNGTRSSSSLSNHVHTIEEAPAATTKRERYYGGRSKSSSRSGTFNGSSSSIDEPFKPLISGPFNFQHVTHTRQEQLPCLERTSRNELVSEFSALRASQAPLHGHLKGIRADDLTLDTFCPDALEPQLDSQQQSTASPPTGHPRSRQNTITTPPSPLAQQELVHAQSHDQLSSTLPLSPSQLMRRPSDLTLPMPPPPRISSRTASMVWDSFDTMNGLALDRPQTSASHARKKHSFHLPNSEPLPMTHSTEERFVSAPAGQRTPEIEQWPLPTPELESPKPALADVPEEEELAAKRRSKRMSMRHSKSVPSIRNARQYDESILPTLPVPLEMERPITPDTVSTLRHEEDFEEVAEIGMALSPTPSMTVKITHESWEDDIDYCYEHEVEANCDYDWDRRSFNDVGDSGIALSAPLSPLIKKEQLDRFRPSLLVPSPLDLPSLSPTSSTTTPTSSTNPMTPSGSTRPSHLRSPSQASSFKESHGFTLSPSLLIPADYASAMDSLSGLDCDEPMHTFNDVNPFAATPPSPTSNARSSTTSSSTYRSSAFSRSSRTSNTTSISSSTNLPKTLSQESMHMPNRASSAVASHKSVSSASSFPELAHHFRKPQPYLDAEENGDFAAPGPAITYTASRRRTNSSARSTMTSHPSVSHVTVHPPQTFHGEGPLSPVHEIVSRVMAGERHPAVEKFEASLERRERERIHGRKFSVPMLSTTDHAREKEAERPKTSGGRKRAGSSISKSKGVYGLFPVS